jgi:hypothetical protein
MQSLLDADVTLAPFHADDRVAHGVQVAQLRLIALMLDLNAHSLEGRELQLPIDHDLFLRHLTSQLPADEALVTQATAMHTLLKPLSAARGDSDIAAMVKLLQHSKTSEAICVCIIGCLLSNGHTRSALEGMSDALARIQPGNELIQQLSSIKVGAGLYAVERVWTAVGVPVCLDICMVPRRNNSCMQRHLYGSSKKQQLYADGQPGVSYCTVQLLV